MTDSEIITALKCCSDCFCNECPYDGKWDCAELLAHDSLDLIKRQKAEIERYEKEKDAEFSNFEILDKSLKEHYKGLYEDAKEFVRVKAIKEFAELMKCRLTIF